VRSVFVEAEDGSAVLADRFIPSLPVELGEPLRAAARDLADQGWLDSGDTWRAFPGRPGRYSIWIEDEAAIRRH
jgi:exonuclease III